MVEKEAELNKRKRKPKVRGKKNGQLVTMSTLGTHVTEQTVVNKCQRKPKVQSRMDHLVTMSTLDTQDTGRRKTKQTNTEN